jgi:hypothetical protein
MGFNGGTFICMTFRRCLLRTLLAFALPAGMAIAQPRVTQIPTILKGPSDWRFEKMPTPPAFAPDITLTGYEEARFAPGMFDNTSPNYFTYVLVFSVDSAGNLDRAALKDFLEKYYRGLSLGLGRQKGMSPDPGQMNAEVIPVPSDKTRCTATVTFFDSFTDGRKITLNIEGRVVAKAGEKKTGLVLLISPKPKTDAVWQKLREIDSKIDFSGGE